MTPKLIISDGQTQREMLLVGDLVVGRDPVCDISGDDALLSRRHAQFVVGGAEIRVRDLGSRNGIYVNGRKVADATLVPGDVLAIGHFQIQFVQDAAPLASVVANAVSAAPAAPVVPVAIAPDDDRTKYVGPPRPDAPAPAPAAGAATDDDRDATRLVPPPLKPSAPPAPAPKAPAVSDHEDFTRAVPPPLSSSKLSRPSLVPPATPAGYDDHEETRFVQGPAPSSGTPRLGSFEIPPLEGAPPPPAKSAVVAVTPALGVAPQTSSSATGVPEASAGWVYGYAAGLAIIVAAAVAAPFAMSAVPGPMAAAWLAGSAVISALAVAVVGASINRRIRGINSGRTR